MKRFVNSLLMCAVGISDWRCSESASQQPPNTPTHAIRSRQARRGRGKSTSLFFFPSLLYAFFGNAADLEKAWAHEMATGGLAAQWADEFEAELARIEAEMEGKSGRNLDVLTTNGMDSSEENDTDEGEVDNELYCFACDKSFASQAAKLNHEASKKHKKQVELLREALLEEERLAVGKAGSEIEQRIGRPPLFLCDHLTYFSP